MGGQFKLTEIIIPTGVARTGMTVGDVFEECVACDVSGIPFCDDQGNVTGRVSIRHTMKMTCIPDYMVKGAHLLGDRIGAVTMPGDLASDVLRLPVDPFVIERLTIVTPAAMMIKVMAMMEQNNTDYAFVIDDDDAYRGVVTRMGIANLMLKAGNR